MATNETKTKIVTIANRKGGCSKTTTVKAMAEILSVKHDKKILVVDCDPQGNLSKWSGIDTTGKDTTYEVLMQKCATQNAIINTKYYDIIPADEVLSSAEVELSGVVGHEYRLREALEEVQDNYDFILIDTPPTLGLLSILSFVAAKDGILIVTDTGMFATEGISRLVESLNAVQKFYNPNAKVKGILLTRYNPRFKANATVENVTQVLCDHYDAPLFDTRIRTAVAMCDATTYGIPLLELTPKPKPMQDYEDFIAEFLGKAKPAKAIIIE